MSDAIPLQPSARARAIPEPELALRSPPCGVWPDYRFSGNIRLGGTTMKRMPAKMVNAVWRRVVDGNRRRVWPPERFDATQ